MMTIAAKLPKLALPGCVAIAARTRFSCYLAGARAIDNTAAKKDIAAKIDQSRRLRWVGVCNDIVEFLEIEHRV